LSRDFTAGHCTAQPALTCRWRRRLDGVVCRAFVRRPLPLSPATPPRGMLSPVFAAPFDRIETMVC